MAVGDVLQHAPGAPATFAPPGADDVLTYPPGGVAAYVAPVPGNLVLTIQPSGLAGYSALPSVFTPASLDLMGWWRAPYPGKAAMDGGTPWVGEASAGTSGTRNLTNIGAGSPHDGALVNGFLPARFDGTISADRLAEPASNAVLFSASAGSAWFLIFPTAAAAHQGPGVLYRNGNLLTDPLNGETDFAFTTSGCGLVILDAVDYKEVTTPCATGAWHLMQCKWDGATIKVRVDSGAWASAACGPWVMTTPGAMQLGFGFADVIRFDGSMLELGVSATVISDVDFDAIKAYVNLRYGLSL